MLAHVVAASVLTSGIPNALKQVIVKTVLSNYFNAARACLLGQGPA